MYAVVKVHLSFSFSWRLAWANQGTFVCDVWENGLALC
jgi:hypothetical protein